MIDTQPLGINDTLEVNEEISLECEILLKNNNESSSRVRDGSYIENLGMFHLQYFSMHYQNRVFDQQCTIRVN